jgi:2'-5' RNA ligase
VITAFLSARFLGVMLTEEFLRARQTLLEVVGRDTHRRFTPHLTLAMRLKGHAAQAMLADLQSIEWETQHWRAPIDALHLMQRGPGHPAWRSIARLPLGQA